MEELGQRSMNVERVAREVARGYERLFDDMISTRVDEESLKRDT